jgi:uncharacterized protein YqjF (DUF2071 family)
MLSSDVDRIASTLRPDGKVVGYQKWRSLAFLHWAVPVEELRRLVPAPFALDLYEGTGLVGVVPFAMREVRPSWWPRMLVLNFLETNLRTYVVCDKQPGVYFFSLDADSRLAVWGGRASFGLPYHHARMRMTESGGEVVYRTRRGGAGPSHHVRYRVGESLGPSQPGTLEHFLLERYLLFVQRGKQVLVGQVHHSPYPARKLHVVEVQDELVAAAGLPAVTVPPLFAHYSPGVDVEIFPLRDAVAKDRGGLATSL